MSFESPVKGRRGASRPNGTCPEYDCAVASTPLPPEFSEGRLPTPGELTRLPGASHEAIQTIERCIEMHHIVELDYTDEHAKRSTIAIRPAYVRYNVADHLVVWALRVGRENWEEFRLDRLHAARDTGEEFTPSW